MNPDAVKHITPKEFCSAINIANPKPEPNVICYAIEGCVDEPQQRIGTLQPIPYDNRSACGLSTSYQSRKIGDAELAVTIGVCEVFKPRSCKAGAKRAPIPAIYVVAYQTNDLAMLLDDSAGHRSSVVAGTIVNKNDLIGCCKRGERGERIGDQPL